MDYKRSNAPLNTVTRDVIKLSQDTGNVYETVCIIAKRANQIAVEMKKNFKSSPLSTTTLKKFPKTESRLKSPVTTRNCRNLCLSQLRNTSRAK